MTVEANSDADVDIQRNEKSVQVGHAEHAKPSKYKSNKEGHGSILQEGNSYIYFDIRQSLGDKLHTVSDVINQNLVAARFGVFSGVVLLTAYGISQTPLFFRFRTVSEIPASYFSNRRILYGRVIGIEETNNNQSILVLVRHLSPVGQLMPKDWFEFFMKFNPLAAQLARTRQKHTAEETKTELLRVKIAGIQAPPASGQSYGPEQFLERLAKDRAWVSCELLARQVPYASYNHKITVGNDSFMDGKKIGLNDDFAAINRFSNCEDGSDWQQIAVCRLYHRPVWFQIFPNDIAESLISSGIANVSPSMFQDALDGSDDQQRALKTSDSSKRLQDLRYDVKYLDRLAKAEFKAAGKSIGMWSLPEVREIKREVVEEIEFQMKSNILQKLLRWLRG